MTSTHEIKRPRARGSQRPITDARMALLLINHARRRALVRGLGIPPEHVNVVTLIGLALIAGAAHDSVSRRLRSLGAPRRSDTMLAAAAAKAAVVSIAGPTIEDMPGLGALVTVALAARIAKPVATRSMHVVAAGTRQLGDAYRRYKQAIEVVYQREGQEDQGQA